MKCPVCRATYRSPDGNRGSEVIKVTSPDPPSPIPAPLNCHRCGVDLSPLIHLYDQAIWCYRHAIQALQAGNYPVAISWNHQALALYRNNADFHALEGHLWALQGEFQSAVLAWQKARQINPQHKTTNVYLEALDKVVEG